jgi:hypothetical protein
MPPNRPAGLEVANTLTSVDDELKNMPHH